MNDRKALESAIEFLVRSLALVGNKEREFRIPIVCDSLAFQSQLILCNV